MFIASGWDVALLGNTIAALQRKTIFNPVSDLHDHSVQVIDTSAFCQRGKCDWNYSPINDIVESLISVYQLSASLLINAHFFLSPFLVTSNNDMNAKIKCPSLFWQLFAPQMCLVWSSHSKYMCTRNENTWRFPQGQLSSCWIHIKHWNIYVSRCHCDCFKDAVKSF